MKSKIKPRNGTVVTLSSTVTKLKNVHFLYEAVIRMTKTSFC